MQDKNKILINKLTKEELKNVIGGNEDNPVINDELGKLNAANASPEALEHANENSIVGQLGALP